ncbi:hypothetical protein NA57DRAFT_74299 [Rhizodiscina lignyota]|uniref:Uncharacterized protein n=1 Tax=Rhizodiscina lignyota TaxID=1504668 RepID=A0A9P4IFA9_9PEZI|nr:hypothetical protein NA57DRAFT_74299 [Rhizodiscina lignyota]
MLFSKTIALAAIALFQIAAAIPPACLLGALNSQQNLGDIKGICSNGASDIQKGIAQLCGDNSDAAMKSFADTCKQVAGVSVSTAASSTESGSKTASGSHSATGTSSVDVLNPSASGTGSGSGSGSATGSAAATGTGAAGRNTAGSFAAVAMAVAGFAMAV